jgi:ribosomal protein L15
MVVNNLSKQELKQLIESDDELYVKLLNSGEYDDLFINVENTSKELKEKIKVDRTKRIRIKR